MASLNDPPADLYRGPEQEALDALMEGHPWLTLGAVAAEVLAAFIGELPDPETEGQG